MKLTLLVITLFILDQSLSAQDNSSHVASRLPVPSTQQMDWHRMEMNAFIHFTMNTFTDREWGFGDESPALFNPLRADPGQWVSVLKKAGFQGIILTVKHHDGFCLWPSAFTRHSVKNSPWKMGKGDLVKELSEACKQSGMKFGIYLSPWDRNHADYGSSAYIDYYRNQLKELISGYGPFFEIWFDGANGGDGYYGGARDKRSIDGSKYYDWPGTIEMVDKISPGAIFFSDAGPGCRWVGNEDGHAGETNWNTISLDTLYAGKPGITGLLNRGSENGTSWVPAECDVSIRPGWFWHEKENSRVKTPEQLFEIYLSSVGRGSNLLLNVPPNRDGRIDEADIRSLTGFRKLLDAAFKKNLAKGASAVAKGSGAKVSALTDGNPESFWQPATDEKTVTIEVDLPKPQVVHFIVLQEYIEKGQRVKSFHIQGLTNDGWKSLTAGTTIGYKRILKIVPVSLQQIRVQIDDAKAPPVLREICVY